MNSKKRLLIGPLVILLALLAVVASWAEDGYGETANQEGTGVILEAQYGYQGAAKGGRYVPLDVSVQNLEKNTLNGSLDSGDGVGL